MISNSPIPSRLQRGMREALALLALGAPIIGAQLAQVSMSFVDTVMAGRLSAQDLAAVALGVSLWIPICVFGMGVLMSVSPTVAHAYGAGQYGQIGHQVRQGLWLSVVVGSASFIAVRGCSPILRWLEVEPAIVPTTAGFLNAISWGAPAYSAFVVLRGFSEAISKTRPVLAISIVGLLANIAGNYVFIYGKFGMPRLGAIGCGVASAIVMWVMPLSFVIWIMCDRYYRSFGVFRRFSLPDGEQLWAFAKLGVPIGACLFMECSTFATVSLLMGRLGTNSVAGHQIALNVASVTFMVPLGISIAITVRVGQAMGRGQVSDARRSGLVGASLAAGFMSVAALTMAIGPHSIAGIYTQDNSVLEIAVQLLIMAAIFQIFDGSQIAAAAALRGLKDTAIPMCITLVAYWGVGLPLGYWLGIAQNRGPRALWIGLIAGLVIAAVLLLTRFVVLTRRLMAQSLIDSFARAVPIAPEAAESARVEEFVRISGSP
jgi:MATE family multidrug resistance protein